MQVNSIAAQCLGAGLACWDVTDHNTLMRYLISVLIFSHFQRPSVVANMTVEEFVRSKKAFDGRWVVLVSDHKTGAQGPAQVALEHQHYKLFDLYARRLVSVHYYGRYITVVHIKFYIVVDFCCSKAAHF